jgi:hypothetical protein
VIRAVIAPRKYGCDMTTQRDCGSAALPPH